MFFFALIMHVPTYVCVCALVFIDCYSFYLFIFLSTEFYHNIEMNWLGERASGVYGFVWMHAHKDTWNTLCSSVLLSWNAFACWYEWFCYHEHFHFFSLVCSNFKNWSKNTHGHTDKTYWNRTCKTLTHAHTHTHTHTHTRTHTRTESIALNDEQKTENHPKRSF